MRILLTISALALAANLACANRSDTATSTATGAATGTTTPQASTTANATASASSQTPAQLTPQDLERRMKEIGTSYPALRKHLMGGMTADAAKEAQELATLFGDVERFWAQHKRTDAVKWAQDARTFATEASGAATAGDAMKATQAANNMQAACKQCHGTNREADPAGGLRIRAGIITP